MDENSTVHGDLEVVAAATLGAGSTVGGNLVTGGALTLGAGDEVGGNVISGAAILVGTNSTIKGNLTSLSTVGLGAQVSVEGAVTAVTSLTLGASAKIGSTAITEHWAGTTATIPGTATVNGGNGQINEGAVFDKNKTDAIKDSIANRKVQLTEYQKNMSKEKSIHDLPVTIVKDRTLTPGVYHATALTTAAGITLTFGAADNGAVKTDAEWIINVDTFISLGENLKMVFATGWNGTIIFNSGSHIAIGAGSELIGTMFANTDITTGAGMKLKGEAGTGSGTLCGGLFSTNGAITLGAGNEIGSDNCTPYFNSPVAQSAVHTGPARRPVNLRAAEKFTILAKAGITNIGNHETEIIGHIGSSPIAASFMDNVHCNEMGGFTNDPDSKIYGVDASYAGGVGGTECSLGDSFAKTLVDNAVLDMGVAYADAAGRTAPDYSEYGAGKISDERPLKPGLYKWGTNVVMDKDITLVGGPDDVWIFQISGNFYQAGETKMYLGGTALAKNVFWQLTENVALGDGAEFIGVVLAKTHIALNPLAEVNGRLLSQTQVTLQDNVINQGDEQ
jgi:cytoskeletal protein CcmA (bactofilin family)